MELNVHEFMYAICKGRVQSYVAKAKEPPERIVKSINTLISSGSIVQGGLEKMLTEVMAETVRPFLGPPWNQSQREERFQTIKKALIYKGIGDKRSNNTIT